MSWYNKETPTPFDTTEIEGIFFIDGDILAKITGSPWVENQKYPQIEFPSGITFDVWESSQPNNAIIHLFGEMDLAYRQTRDEAYEYASKVAEQCGYLVSQRHDNQLIVIGHDEDEHLVITYDNETGQMVDVTEGNQNEWQQPIHPGHQLMTDEIRESLPPLYANEEQGLEAIAPVKYFHPLSNWTWYASEFDGKDLFFGLVDGFELELGHFSLSELQSIGQDNRTLPVERDLYHEPKSLKELIEYHRKLRGGQ